MQTICIPGSSHGGKAKSSRIHLLEVGPAFDQQDTTSLLGGRGGVLTFFCHFHVLHHISFLTQSHSVKSSHYINSEEIISADLLKES